jgi:predicted benzoate:H+ symporter BenE
MINHRLVRTALVTVADMTVLNICAAFWELVVGFVVSVLVDPQPAGTSAGP